MNIGKKGSLLPAVTMDGMRHAFCLPANTHILYVTVSFAIKENFENQIVGETATINLVDVGANEIFNKLAEELKSRSKYLKS